VKTVRVILLFGSTFAGSGQHVLLAQAHRNPASNYPIQPLETSSLIGRLRTQIQSGKDVALAKFWREIEESGTPVIERTNDDSQNVVVAFLWRGDPQTQSAELVAPLENVPRMPHLALKRLPDTNVWYGSWRMPDDLRFTYRLTATGETARKPEQVNVPDPLNPRTMTISFEGGTIPTTELAIASMPNAPPENWITKQPTAPGGTVVQLLVNSKALAGERKIWVYTPPGYDQKAPETHPLLVLFDGFSYLHWIPTPTILDNLIQARKIPAFVAVLVDNPPDTRSSDLGYNTVFTEYLANELMHWIRTHYAVTHDAGRTIIGGYSDGGAAAVFAAMTRPDLFGNVLSQSGAFWEGHGATQWEFLASQYAQTAKLPLHFFIEAGSLEDIAKDGPSLLAANRHFVEVLRKKNYEVVYEEVGGTHEPVHWRDTLPDGLVSLSKHF
jgi:enterochelin esterase-like enzyme